ncbi:hypothetical protein AC249_AIPGENE3909, partial [Exaiptasia diaphana]
MKDKNSDELIALTWTPEGRRHKDMQAENNMASDSYKGKGAIIGFGTWEEARSVAANSEKWISSLCTTGCEAAR